MPSTNIQWLKMGLSGFTFGLGLYYWVQNYPFSSYSSSWYPNIVVMVALWWAVGFALPLKQGEKLKDSEVLHWFFSTFYIGLLLLIPVYLWGEMLRVHHRYLYDSGNLLDLRSSASWIPILLGLLFLRLGAWFFMGEWGKRLCQKRLFQGLSLSLMGFIGICLLLELFLRTPYSLEKLIGPFPPQVRAEYAFTPRQNWGMEDMTVAIPKPADKLRVLFVGDSYTYGVGVFDEDRYPLVLQSFAPEDVEVVTLALGGLSTYDEWQAWREVGVGVEADVVIIGVVANDPHMNLLEQVPLFYPSHIYFSKLFPTSSLAFYVDSQNWFAYERPTDRGALSYDEWEKALYTDPENQRLWVEVVENFYAEITATGAEAWAYILAMPGETELDRVKYERLEAVFAAAGFRTHNFFPDMLRDFKPARPKQYCAFPNDCHPNAEIHAYYAQRIWADLETLRASR